MGFPKPKFANYNNLPWNDLCNGQFATDEEAGQLVCNALALYGQCMHNVASGSHIWPAEGDETDIKLDAMQADDHATVLNIPLRHVVTGASRKLRLAMLIKHTAGAGDCYISTSAGRNVSTFDIDGVAGNWVVYYTTIDLDAVESVFLRRDDRLRVSVMCRVTDSVHIRSISSYELPGNWRTSTSTHDLSNVNCKIGSEDYPYTPAMQRLLAEEMAYLYANRMPRGNVYNHCFRTAKKTVGAAYDGDSRGLGSWFVRKADGVTQVDGKWYGGLFTGAGTCRFYVGLWSFHTLVYQGQTVNYTAGKMVVGQTSGAKARILRDADAGPVGTLYIGPITKGVGGATFTAGEVLKDEAGGTALQNGGIGAGGAIVGNETDDNAGPWAPSWHDFSLAANVITEDAEYEVRMDAKRTLGVTSAVTVPMVGLVEKQGAAVTFEAPSASRVQENDDVSCHTWRKVKELLLHIRNRKRQIMMTDWRHTRNTFPPVRTLRDNYDKDEYQYPYDSTMARGFVFPSEGSRALIGKFFIRKPDISRSLRVPFDNGVGGWVPGDWATGPNIKGRLIHRDANPAGYLYLEDIVSGSVADNDALAFDSGGNCLVNGYAESVKADIRLKFATFTAAAAGTNLSAQEVSITGIENRESVFEVTFRIAIHESFWDDMTTQASGNAYEWVLMGKTDQAGDYAILDGYQVYEEPVLPGIWDITREDE